jgi:hypothetical protein
MRILKAGIYYLTLILMVACSGDNNTATTDNEEEVTPPVEEKITWPLATPKLTIVGKYLKDPCGNTVNLHGVAITPSPWFNGGAAGIWRWKDYDIQGCLEYNTAIIDNLSNGDKGWYLNYVRLHIDPYWSNNPGMPVTGESDISQFNFERFKDGVEKVIIPLIEHAKQRGMYVILRPPGVCPDVISVGGEYQAYLIKVWDYLSKHSYFKNSNTVMFELANEPIRIKLPDGTDGANTQPHFDQLKLFFQPIVDLIRNNGANNILWIPGSGWQSEYKGYAVNPIVGANIGYSVHIYPGYWGQDNNDPVKLKRGWNENIKPVADIAPIAITEIDWAPDGYDVWGKGGVTGEAGVWGFGANLKAIIDESGNVSWNLLAPEDLIDKGEVNAGIAFDNNPQACANAVNKWFKEYAKKAVNCSSAK